MMAVAAPSIPELCRRYHTSYYYSLPGGIVGVRWLLHIVWFEWNPACGEWEPVAHGYSRRGAAKRKANVA